MIRLTWSPFREFLTLEQSSGILLLLASIAALLIANSPWRNVYYGFLNIPIALDIGKQAFVGSLQFWVNEGLMTLFFLYVGLEIKRELLIGELNSWRKALFPLIAAIGGMLIPALLYHGFNLSGTEGAIGWGIPTATDIAFAVTITGLLGKRIPLPLKVFLVAFAIADDLGAIVIIALFYSQPIHWINIGFASLWTLLLLGLNMMKTSFLWFYGFLGVLLWASLIHSGIHATLAGVIMAFMLPAKTRTPVNTPLGQGAEIIGYLQTIPFKDPAYKTRWYQLRQRVVKAMSPLQRLEFNIHPWVNYLIIPLFAFCNTGISLRLKDLGVSLSNPIAIGIIVGLVFGKPIGITLFSWLSLRLNLASLPSGIRLKQIAAISLLGGIGFTMSLFMANLSFKDQVLLDVSKVGILTASFLSGFLGWLCLRQIFQKTSPSE